MRNAACTVFGAICTLAIVAIAIPAHAENYPSKPVRIIIPWQAGGFVDIFGRVMSDRLRLALGQPFIVENKVGASGMIGSELVAKSNPDGYTLLVTSNALNMVAALRSGRLNFDVLRDLDPIVIAAYAPSVLVVGPSLNVDSVKALIALARVKPGDLTYASAGIGTPAHFAGEMFRAITGVDIVHIPYKGGPLATSDLIAGRVDMQFMNYPVVLPHLKAGRLHALAMTSGKRSSLLPNVPTVDEAAGVSGFDISQWLGFLAPHGVPREVVERIDTEVNRAIAMEDVKAAIARSGMEVAGSGTPQSFATLMRDELQKYKGIVKAAKIKAE